MQIQIMKTNNIAFSFTAYELIDQYGGGLNKKVDINQRDPLSYHDMLKKKATLGCSTVMIDKFKIGKIVMPAIRTGQDYALWLNILKLGFQAHPVNTVLAKYRLTPNSISRNKIKKALRQWEIYRRFEGIGVLLSFYYFMFYAFRAIFRK